MLRLSQKGDTPMTDKDKELYLDILLALGGYSIKEKNNDEKTCQSICQSKPQTLENTEFLEP